jgi:hypothetical protein
MLKGPQWRERRLAGARQWQSGNVPAQPWCRLLLLRLDDIGSGEQRARERQQLRRRELKQRCR